MDELDPSGKVALLLDEWGTWFDVEPGTNPGHLYQQNTMRDAIVAALNFDIFHKYTRRLKMANIAQVVNVLQAMILTDETRMVLTPTYHVFEMYNVHQDAEYVESEVLTGHVKTERQCAVPEVDATVSRKDGETHISLVNTDLKKAKKVLVTFDGAGIKKISEARVLTSKDVRDYNDFDKADVVKPVAFKDYRRGQARRLQGLQDHQGRSGGHPPSVLRRRHRCEITFRITMNIIECKQVCKNFGEKVALDHVSLEIPEGQIFGLLGPNGAGKTTLIRIINRITIPTSGEIIFNGRPITQADVAKIGYMPEERGLYRKMKVGEQAIYLAQLKGMSASAARKALKEWFVRFGIQDWWDKKVEELSKGMAQKLQFITTVVHKPSLMILDEPFSGFDPVNAEIIRQEILRLKDEGATIILSTHNMESVEELCDNIALINKSRLVITGGVTDIRRKYGNNNVELVWTDADGRHTEVLPRETDGASTLRTYLDKEGVQINSYKELMPRMNDIFIKLVTEGEE